MNSLQIGESSARSKCHSPIDVLTDRSGIGPIHIIDPSLFTAPYDEALAAALIQEGLSVKVVGRTLRPGDEPLSVPYRPFFYRLFDRAPRPLGQVGAALKAAEHIGDGLALALSTRGIRHYQWLPFPLADAVLLRAARRRGPVVVTVHDTAPFNGNPTHRLQTSGFAAALRVADRLVVHTSAGRDRLAALGTDPGRIAVVPHGPLGQAAARPRRSRGGRYTVVAFGKIRPYKGLDVLLDALARLDVETRRTLRLIIAGEPMMDMGPILAQIRAGGLAGTVDLLPRRLDQPEMDALFESADAFVFPYREIEASGVFYLVQGLGRWIIASRIGAFAEALDDGVSGRLVAPGDVAELTGALGSAAASRQRPLASPRVTGWRSIAGETIGVYEAAWNSWNAARAPRPTFAAAQ